MTSYRSLTVLTACVLALAPTLALAAPASSMGYGASDAPNWAGAYAGIHVGYVSGSFTGHSATEAGPTGSDGGFMGGLQAGYNWQQDRIVYGGEADFSLTPIHAADSIGRLEDNWNSTLRARAGYTFGKWLPYGTLGLAMTNTDSKIGTGSVNNAHVGFTGGAGVDYALVGGLSARAEYLYVDVPKESDTIAATKFSGGSSNNIFRIGANYRFW